MCSGERAGFQPAVAGSLPAIIRIINAIRNHSLGKAAETYRLAAVLPPRDRVHVIAIYGWRTCVSRADASSARTFDVAPK